MLNENLQWVLNLKMLRQNRGSEYFEGFHSEGIIQLLLWFDVQSIFRGFVELWYLKFDHSFDFLTILAAVNLDFDQVVWCVMVFLKLWVDVFFSLQAAPAGYPQLSFELKFEGLYICFALCIVTLDQNFYCFTGGVIVPVKNNLRGTFTRASESKSTTNLIV